MFDWSDCIRLINKAQRVAVLPHLSADGDGLGSAFSLAMAIDSLGKKAVVLLEEPVEGRLEFMLPLNKVEYYILPEKPEGDFDLAIAVDAADRLRLGNRQEIFFRAGASVKIDHHIEKDPFGEFNYVNQKWAANCEGIWELLCHEPWNLEGKLSGRNTDEFYHALAKCLYCGIATDTGSFAYSNTTENTHRIAGKLLAVLGDVSEYHFRLFDCESKACLALKGISYGKISYSGDGKMAFLLLTQDDFDKAGATYDDANDIVNVLRGIEGVELAVFGRPGRNGNGVKVSMRSNKFYDVAAFSMSQGGGGHVRAAGFDFNGDFEELKKDVVDYYNGSK
ncbi:MAG: bifunctional oligoribonuclease/PAP phosphatase NrnA [Ruminococcaceae bacterium]|nr:bifunctional oligoribonuclease/PAP phosphatase NrnA [Oscillospiraceae bacterium]